MVWKGSEMCADLRVMGGAGTAYGPANGLPKCATFDDMKSDSSGKPALCAAFFNLMA
jgi:hypothetical protein